MKRITYQGEHLVTEDAAADAVLRYAQLLALSGKADVIQVPAVEPAGDLVTVELLVGPASQFISEPLPPQPDIVLDIAAFLDELRARAARLERDHAVVERFFEDGVGVVE